MHRKTWGQSGLMKAAVVLALLGWVLVPASAALGKTLWNNGDWDQWILCPNNIITNSEPLNRWQIGFDDFQVPAPGWLISGLWADLAMFPPPNHATIEVLWTIRSGCAPGGAAGFDLGTGFEGLVAGGRCQATITLYHDQETNGHACRIQVDGLYLSIDPGTYWLNITPFNHEAYNLRTSGENAVGNPPGNNDNSLWAGQIVSQNHPGYDGNFLRLYERPVIVNGYDPYTMPVDLAMGISGRVLPGAPLPGTVLLLGAGLGCLAIYQRKKVKADN